MSTNGKVSTLDVTIVQAETGPAPRTLADDVHDGLTRPLKELPTKYLYEGRGSDLFEAITTLPEYYPTRTEHAILQARANELAARTGAVEVVELGSGYATKTRTLLDALADAGTLKRYVPLDFSAATVEHLGEEITSNWGISVHGIVGDFEVDLGLLPEPAGPRLIAFLGGTIGNLMPGSRRHFLRKLAARSRPDDHLLIGVDLVKAPAIIELAYNDAAGVSSDFNRNILQVVNDQLGADFPLEDYEHVAFFDPHNEWVDIRLRATRDHTVTIDTLELEVPIAAGEDIRTEISSKFTRVRLERDLDASGFELVELYTDADELFGLALCRPTNG